MRQFPYWGALFILSGCYVNHALVDPWSWSPEESYCFSPKDRLSAALYNPLCLEESLVTLPDENQVLSLAEVLNIAMLNNPETKITWAQARLAAAQYAESESPALPTLTGQYFYNRERAGGLTSSFGDITPGGQTALFVFEQSTWGPQLQLSYTLFDFGQRRATSEAARYTLYFSNYTHDRAIQTQLENVTLDFYNALYQVKQMQALEANMGNARETLEAAELGLKTGVKDISDVLQAKTKYLQVEVDLFQQQQNIQIAYSQLLNDMGLPATQVINLQAMPDVHPKLTLEPVDCFIQMAIKMRPDLLAARASVVSAEKSLRAAKLLVYPSVNYTLDFGRTNFSGGFTDNYDYSSTLTLNLPIFSGFWYRNNIKAACATLEEQEATLEQIELEAIQQIVNAHSNVSVTIDTLRASYTLLSCVEEQYKISLAQYCEGTGTILDVTSALAALFDARAQVASSLKNWFSALATLAYSAGTLTKPPESL